MVGPCVYVGEQGRAGHSWWRQSRLRVGWCHPHWRILPFVKRHLTIYDYSNSHKRELGLFAPVDETVVGNIWKHREIHLHLLGPPRHCRNSSQVCSQGCWQRARSPGGRQVPHGAQDTSPRLPAASVSSSRASWQQMCQIPRQHWWPAVGFKRLELTDTSTLNRG